MPQFDFGNNFWMGQIFWMIIFFIILWGIFIFLILPKIRRTLNAREQKISLFISQAEDAQYKLKNLQQTKNTLITDTESTLKQLRKNMSDKISSEITEMKQVAKDKEDALIKQSTDDIHQLETKLTTIKGDMYHSLYTMFVHKMKHTQ